MVRRRGARRDSRNHGRFGIGRKTILQNQGQFGTPVRYMRGLLSQGTNAFFQTEERGIDVRGFGPALRVVRFGVTSSFATGQVDQAELAPEFAGITVAQKYLTNGVRTRRRIICFRLLSCTETAVQGERR